LRPARQNLRSTKPPQFSDREQSKKAHESVRAGADRGRTFRLFGGLLLGDLFLLLVRFHLLFEVIQLLLELIHVFKFLALIFDLPLQ